MKLFQFVIKVERPSQRPNKAQRLSYQFGSSTFVTSLYSNLRAIRKKTRANHFHKTT